VRSPSSLKAALLVAPGVTGLLFCWQELGKAATPFIATIVLLVAYSSALSIGRPILLGLLVRGRGAFVAALIAGLASGALPVLVVGQLLHVVAAEGLRHWALGLVETLVFPAQVGGYGMVGGLVLWGVALIFEKVRPT
jgi:hypothetical protein